MNRIYAIFAPFVRQTSRTAALLCAMAVMISLAACTDNQDATHQPQITATALPATNTNLLSVKQKYSNVLGKNNTFEQVKQDLVFEGVVVANDISGNLYQTLVVRHIGSQPGALDDQ